MWMPKLCMQPSRKRMRQRIPPQTSPTHKKNLEAELFMFINGHGTLPEGFDEIYLCELLDIPLYTDLVKQPAWFLERKKLWVEAKAKVQESKNQPKQP